MTRWLIENLLSELILFTDLRNTPLQKVIYKTILQKKVWGCEHTDYWIWCLWIRMMRQ